MTLPVISNGLTKSANSLQVYKGEYRDVEVVITQDVVENGEVVETAVDLATAVVTFTVRRRASDPDLLIKKTSDVGGGIDINTPTTEGSAVIHLYSSDTSLLDADVYVFDVWVELDGGKRYPVVEISEFKILEPVSRF